jgi:hypothetical protein
MEKLFEKSACADGHRPHGEERKTACSSARSGLYVHEVTCCSSTVIDWLEMMCCLTEQSVGRPQI